LAAHLERFLTDEAARNEYARRGRLQAQEFTWDRTWREFSSLMPLSD
jgi:hypothetical protein